MITSAERIIQDNSNQYDYSIYNAMTVDCTFSYIYNAVLYTQVYIFNFDAFRKLDAFRRAVTVL
jgi:hypothetical protein